MAAIAAALLCRKVREEESRYAHLLISEDDVDADVYRQIAGVSRERAYSGGRRRSSGLMSKELAYAIDAV